MPVRQASLINMIDITEQAGYVSATGTVTLSSPHVKYLVVFLDEPSLQRSVNHLRPK